MRSILIAEHCLPVRALLRRAIANEGYDVRTAEVVNHEP